MAKSTALLLAAIGTTADELDALPLPAALLLAAIGPPADELDALPLAATLSVAVNMNGLHYISFCCQTCHSVSWISYTIIFTCTSDANATKYKYKPCQNLLAKRHFLFLLVITRMWLHTSNNANHFLFILCVIIVALVVGRAKDLG